MYRNPITSQYILDFKKCPIEEKDNRTFDTFQDFKLWKESIEKQTSALYVKNTGTKKLENKIPVEAILDDIRNSINQKLERIHLITRQDIKNIKEEYNISSDGILDSNDVVSINKWVEGLKNREDSPIVLLKDQNIFDKNLYPGMKAKDFLLVIMNASQKDMLKFYGIDTICLDFTHGMNAYGFDLATLLVWDDKREGFPAAFILSNRQDSTALTLAFAAIKEHTCISPRVLMTDDSESFFNAWKTVFGIPEKRLLCTWHVDRNWRRSIARLITKKEMQVEAYKIVRSLLVETDEAAFDIMLKEALKMID
ncbi:MULE domain-containing protein [Trichonephila clavipes]|nr:MULE domain-containing protein [Trichonephila clavipes]